MVVKLFAVLREIAGQDSIEIALDQPVSANEILQQLIRDYPKLERYKPVISFAVNGEYSSGDKKVGDGDELALIPPISGGYDG